MRHILTIALILIMMLGLVFALSPADHRTALAHAASYSVVADSNDGSTDGSGYGGGTDGSGYGGGTDDQSNSSSDQSTY